MITLSQAIPALVSVEGVSLLLLRLGLARVLLDLSQLLVVLLDHHRLQFAHLFIIVT